MAMHLDDTGELDREAPRPVDADSVARGAFNHLEEGEGAVSAAARRREDSQQRVQQHDNTSLPMSRRTYGIIVGAAVVAIVVTVVVFVRALNGPESSANQSAEVEQTAVAVDEDIVLRGGKYEIVQNEGTYQLVEIHEGDGGQRVLLGDIEGTPMSLILYDGALIIPENLSDGTWDVLAYTIGSGWSQITDQEGGAVGGTGTIDAATLEGSTVVLTTDGQRVEVPLVW